MPTMNTNQARVIDPILTTLARGYTNAEFIAEEIAPSVSVPALATRILKFSKNDFKLANTKRAPGADTTSIQLGYSSDPIAISEDSLNAVVPRELAEEAQIPNVDLAGMSIRTVQDIIGLGHEYEVAKLALDATRYGTKNKMSLTGSSQWNDDASTPATDIADAILSVQRQIGRRPNRLILGPEVFKALRNHRLIKEQFKYTSSQSVTAEMLANLLELEKVVVGNAVFIAAGAKDDTEADFIWGKGAVLSYVNSAKNYLSPGHMYSYRRTGYPIVERPYWENSKKSWLYGFTDVRGPQLVGDDAGFLFQTPIA